MDLFDNTNKETKQSGYIWEKTAITAEVFNNLLVPNWKTEKGLDRYLKTIGTRLAQLIDREEDRYYVLNKYKDAIVNTGIMDKFGNDFLVLYRMNLSGKFSEYGNYKPEKLIRSKADFMSNEFTKDQAIRGISPISFIDEGVKDFCPSIEDFDLDTKDLCHMIEERRSRFPENLQSVSSVDITSKLKPLADSSSDVDEYRGVSDEPTSHAEIITEQSSTEDSTTIEPDTNSADDITSSDYSTYGEVIDSDTAEKLSSLGTNYSMVKWDHEFYVEGSDHTLVASTAITPDGIVVAITNLGSKSVSFTGSAHIKGDTNSLSDSIALLEPCLAVGGTTINYTECDSANITSITLEDCSITDAYLTAADWSVNATVTTDGTSSSDYGDNVSINYSYESSTGCSYTSLKVLLLNNVGEVLGYGIGFVNDVPAGENITGTMYAIAAPHSLDSLADMAMFSCPTLE